MTLAGTRPPLIGEVSEYELHHRARLAIKPGITGMWQVSGRSDITDFEEVVELDKEYIENWNIPKLFGKRCIATVHGLDHQRAKWGKLASTYIMLGEKCAVKFADEIIVLSEGVQNYFLDTYGRKTRFIPNGVNRPVICEADMIKEKFGLQEFSFCKGTLSIRAQDRCGNSIEIDIQ